MICKKCGAFLGDGVEICPLCNTKVEKPETDAKIHSSDGFGFKAHEDKESKSHYESKMKSNSFVFKPASFATDMSKDASGGANINVPSGNSALPNTNASAGNSGFVNTPNAFSAKGNIPVNYNPVSHKAPTPPISAEPLSKSKEEKPKEMKKWPFVFGIISAVMLLAGTVCWLFELINFFQLGIGFVPALIGMWLVLALKKSWSVRNVSASIIVTLVCGLSFFMGTVGVAQKETQSYKNLSKETTLSMCYAALSEDNYELAEQIISDFVIYGIYDDDIAIAKSRIEAYKGNYRAAIGISKKAELPNEEKKILEELTKTDNYDAAIVSYAKENDIAVEDMSKNKESKYTHEDLKKAINREIGEYYSEEHKEAAKALVGIDKIYDTYINEGVLSSREVANLKEELEEIVSENGELQSIHALRIIQLKADILTDDYQKAVSRLRKDSFYDEYMIASELLINGYASEEDFNKDFMEYTEEDLKAVIEQLDYIKTQQEGVMSDEDYERFCLKVEDLKLKYTNPLAGALIYGLEEKISNNEVGGDATKVYLQIAKIEEYYGNDNAARDRISEAMSAVGMCDDADYAEPMATLASVASGQNREDVKNVAEYVEYVLDNTVPVKIESNVKTEENKNQQQADNKEEKDTFKELMKNYIVTSSSAITISSIDISEFEKVKARVVFSKEFFETQTLTSKDILVKDCGIDIENFSMKKVDFSNSQVLLCCDNSGSMNGSIDELQAAVNSFVDGKADKEEISLVTFDSGILEQIDFTNNKNTLKPTIDAMRSRGGTDVYGTIVECLDDYTNDKNTNKVMIVMTDGQDGRNADDPDIYDELGKIATDNSITIYTIGLGSGVNIDYLTAIAESTGGSFIYASEAHELAAFYDFIRSKMNNQYEITYSAKDTLTSIGRTLKVSFADNTGIYGERTYNIATEDTTMFELKDGFTILGISPKNVYKSSEDIEVKLNGTGFAPSTVVSVKFKGRLSYDIETQYVDPYVIKLKIPKDIYADIYDVEIMLDGKRAYLFKEFTVINPGSEKTLEYGPYKFTASSIATVGNKHVLNGNVVMNGWLHFKGEVTLEGNLKDGQIKMTDNHGSYSEFTESSAKGLAKIYAKRGIALSIPQFGEITLYNDNQHYNDYDSYRVDKKRATLFKVLSVINIPEVYMSLYPDRVKATYQASTSVLPGQELVVLFKGDSAKLYDVDMEQEASLVVTDKNIGLKMESNFSDLSDLPSEKADDNSRTNYKQAKISNLPIEIDLDKTGMKVDTLEGEYKLSIGFKCNEILGIKGASIAIEWKDLDLDMVELGIDKVINCTISSVPVTFRGFRISAKDISKNEGTIAQKLKKSTFVGKMNVELYNLAQQAPKIAELLKANDSVKDMSLLSMPDTYLSINFADMAFAFGTTLKFINTVEIAKADIKLGKFTFTNDMLCANDTAYGLQGDFSSGFNMSISNITMKLMGTMQANLHSKFVGVGGKVDAELELKLWALEFSKHANAETIVGLHMPDGQDARFVVGYKYTGSGGSVESKLYHINMDGSID